MWMAQLDTRSFTFNAFGRDRAHAQRTMRATWAHHRLGTGATDTWAEVEDGVRYMVIELGAGYTDHDERSKVTAP